MAAWPPVVPLGTSRLRVSRWADCRCRCKGKGKGRKERSSDREEIGSNIGKDRDKGKIRGGKIVEIKG